MSVCVIKKCVTMKCGKSKRTQFVYCVGYESSLKEDKEETFGIVVSAHIVSRS